MKKVSMKQVTANAIGSFALKMAKTAANSKCAIAYHQPKFPEELKKLRNF